MRHRLTILTNIRRTFDGIMKGFRVSQLFYFSLPLLFLLSATIFLNPAKFLGSTSSHENNSQISEESLAPLASKFPLPIQNILKQSEEKIDVGLAALTFAKEIYPDIDVASYSARIDALANRVRRLAGGTKDPDRRVRCLNTVMLLHEKFQGTRDLSVARKPEKYFLNRVLDTKLGNCSSMPLLYIAVSQRLGWPVHLVHVPDHSFVRYVDPALKEQNIETTSKGGYVSDEKYAKDFLVSKRGRKSGAYLRNLSNRELLGDLAAIGGITFGQREHSAKAITYLELSTKLNPRNAAAWRNLIIAYKIMAKRSSTTKAERYFELAAKGSKKLEELGFVNPNEIPQIASARRS